MTDNLAVAKQRLHLLRSIDCMLEKPMIVLSVIWLGLVVVDMSRGLGPLGKDITNAIWIVFLFDFLVRFTIAPRKWRYLRKNWLTAIALLLPALRIFRVARLFRVLARLRGLQLVRILSSINRGMNALSKTMARRGFGYVSLLTVIVTLVGAAGMLYFEGAVSQGRLKDFSTALWWTAMIMTTMGSEYWPRTPEGRALCLFLAVYAFTVFGYFTASIATYFIGRDAESDSADDIVQLKKEIAALREEIHRLTQK